VRKHLGRDSQRPASTRKYLAYGRDLRAAVAHLRAEGARAVFLIGASFGGAAALTCAPELSLAGVISLSGEAQIAGAGLDALAAVPRLRAPVLIVGSRNDAISRFPTPSFCSGAPAHTTSGRPSTPARFTAGSSSRTRRTPVRALVLGWIRAH
jgi:hypothetical protein